MINEIEFADKYLREYRIKRNEINPVHCPFCEGGIHRDKYTFFLNPNKHIYVCHRGSCGAKGTFAQLAKLFRERAGYIVEIMKNRYELLNLSKKEYKRPSMELKKISEQALEYIYTRGISETTIKYFDIKSDEKGNIIFPFSDENGNHVLNKIRIPRKFIKGKDKTKIWQEGSGKPVLLNMDKVEANMPIVIVEGEWDCLSVFEAGYKNVVSIPFGTENMEWIDECWNWLYNCKEFILWFDNDKAGQMAKEKVAKKLGIYRCKFVKSQEKDCNLVLFKYGNKEVINLINDAEYFPIDNLKKLSDTKKVLCERILYGNKFLDHNFGGCRMGEVVIWTGKRGSGKSTVLSQTIIDTVEQKTKCFIYSGELSNSKFKEWLDRQMAGDRYIIIEKDELTGREEYSVHPIIENIINEWYKDYIYCYGDDGANEEEYLFEIMEYAFKRHDVKRFLIDNLKTIKIKEDKEFYRSQGLFVRRLKSFARQYDVHIDLVVHPRKTSNAELDDEDVGGSVDIIDLADNVIVITRITDEVLQKANEEDSKRMQGYNTSLTIKKNREYGEVGVKAHYKFNPKSKRIYGSTGIKTYEWESKVKDKNFVLENRFNLKKEEEEECPF